MSLVPIFAVEEEKAETSSFRGHDRGKPRYLSTLRVFFFPSPSGAPALRPLRAACSRDPGEIRKAHKRPQKRLQPASREPPLPRAAPSVAAILCPRCLDAPPTPPPHPPPGPQTTESRSCCGTFRADFVWLAFGHPGNVHRPSSPAPKVSRKGLVWNFIFSPGCVAASPPGRK